MPYHFIRYCHRDIIHAIMYEEFKPGASATAGAWGLPNELGEDGAGTGLCSDCDFLRQRLGQVDGEVDNMGACSVHVRSFSVANLLPFHLERPVRAGRDIRIEVVFRLLAPWSKLWKF